MDTALCYGNDAQADVASAIESKMVSRSEIFVTTKVPCCPSDIYPYSTEQCKTLRGFNQTDTNIAETIEKVGAGQVDLLLLHWPCNDFEGTLFAYRAMEAVLSQGRVRAIGVSNFNASLLDALQKQTNVKPAVTQNAYSVGNHAKNTQLGSDDGTLKYCKDNGITLSAWAPLGHTSQTGTSIFNNSVVKDIADTHNKSAAQIALRWDIQEGILPVTSGENPEHIREDLDLFDFKLTNDDMARLEAIGQQQLSISV